MLEVEERPIADTIEDVPPPPFIENLVGHDEAVSLFQQSEKSGRLHHAWLLAGPKGIGKASLAFRLAKILLSSTGNDSVVDPSVSAQIANGSHPNVLHLTKPWDEKTKRFKTQLSVDEIRRTQAFYGMTAGADGWRITIVDAADDMNASAANALLKILEEPPKRSLFFVITHSAGSLLPTIRSRCQLLPLRPLHDAELLQVLEQSKIQFGADIRDRIGTLSGGSARRAMMLLEGKVLAHFATFEGLMERRAIGSPSEWADAHKVADALARREAEDDFSLFIDLIMQWLGQAISSGAGQVSLGMLAGWADVWDKATQMITVSNAFNLDRKQLVLNLFGLCFERHAAAQV